MSQSSPPSSLAADIRKHYDMLSAFYQLLWRPHMHHGYWQNGESPAQAQIKLIERLAERLEMAPEHRVLDIGSGLGGSACWLARTFGCSVLGVTLGAAQVQAAQKHAVEQGVDDRVSFREMDANRLDASLGQFDRLWIIECSEHVEDKQAFFHNCARLLLRPGGRLGLCVWLRGEADGPEHDRLVRGVCETTLCPSLLTLDEQVSMLKTAGFQDVQADNITANVLPTWEYCNKVASTPMAKMFLYTKGSHLRRFVDSLKSMEKGYRDGALAYAMITAAIR